MDENLDDEEIYQLLHGLPEDTTISEAEGDSKDDFEGLSKCKSESLNSSNSNTLQLLSPSSINNYDESVTVTNFSNSLSTLTQTDIRPNEHDCHVQKSICIPNLPVVVESVTELPSLTIAEPQPSTSYSSNDNFGISPKDKVQDHDPKLLKEVPNPLPKYEIVYPPKKKRKVDVNIKSKSEKSGKSKKKTKEEIAKEKKLRKAEMRNEGWEEFDEEYGRKLEEYLKLNSYDGAPKVTHQFSITDKEIDYFKRFFGEDILQKICDQTNLYALQNHTKKWNDLTLAELESYFGILIAMGIHVLPAAIHYWSSDPFLCVPGISKVMTVNRYQKIVQNLHVNDNSLQPKKGDKDYDKLYKLRPIIEHLEQKCWENYEPSKHLVVDEAMVAFKGRSSLKQYQPMKPIKRGYKVWCLGDGETGYIVNFDVYTGKKEETDESSANLLLCEKVVLTLCQPVFGTNRTIVLDNFFTTYYLAETLLSNGLFCCGTLRGDREGLPTVLTSKQIILSRGQYTYRTKEGISVIKWMDNKPVCFLSTTHDPKHVVFIDRKEITGSKIKVSCPHVVQVYNAVMGGVDNFDQHRERYQVGRRSRKWWHRLFYFFLELGVINAFKLYKINGGRNDHLHFRINLAPQLIDGFSSRKNRGPKPMFLTKKMGHIGVPDEVRLTTVGKHIPKDSGTRRRCRLCSKKHDEKRTKIMCSSCEVPLCIVPCFELFHK